MVLGLVGILAGCGPSEGDTAGGTARDTAPVDVVAALAAPGPYAVGYRESAVGYPDPAHPGADRTLRLAVWYPTPDTAGTDAVYAQFYPAPGVWDHATVSPGLFPLAVFSHGHQGYAEYSSFLMTHLASHGWIVAAPDHTGNTTFDSPDRTTEIYLQRPGDISAVIDGLSGVLSPDSGDMDEVVAAVAPGPVVAMGHSFGGYTMLALSGGVYDMDLWSVACAEGNTRPFCATMTPDYESRFRAGFRDDRIGGVVIMAGGDTDLFGAAGLAAIEQRVLHMTATEDQGPGSEGDFLWDNLHDGDDVRVILEGAGHQSFTDYANVLEDVPLAQAEAWRIVDVYTLAWGQALRGDDAAAAVLDGTEPVSDAASLLR